MPGKKKKKTKSQRLKSPETDQMDAMEMDEGNQADNEATGNAFMTQFPQTGVMRDDYVDSALRMDAKHKEEGKLAKSKSA